MTDTFDPTAKVLIKVKSGRDRPKIRLAVGQLLDYLRFLPGARGVIATTGPLSEDLEAFVVARGLGITYPEDERWVIGVRTTQALDAGSLPGSIHDRNA